MSELVGKDGKWNATVTVPDGHGSTTGELHAALVAQFGATNEGAPSEPLDNLMKNWGFGVARTNVAFSGGDLTAEDLKRIAECTVTK